MKSCEKSMFTGRNKQIKSINLLLKKSVMKNFIQKFALIFAVLVTENTFSQNLVTNGSFENYTGSCPTGSPNGAFSQVTGGWSPANIIASWGVPHAELY